MKSTIEEMRNPCWQKIKKNQHGDNKRVTGKSTIFVVERHILVRELEETTLVEAYEKKEIFASKQCRSKILMYQK